MDERESVDDWADSLLEHHRSADAREMRQRRTELKRAQTTPSSDDRLVMRVFARFQGDVDPVVRAQLLEKLADRRRSLATLQRIDAIVWLVAAGVACALAAVWFSFL